MQRRRLGSRARPVVLSRRCERRSPQLLPGLALANPLRFDRVERTAQLRTAQLHLVNGLAPLEAGERWIGEVFPGHPEQSLEAVDIMVQSVDPGHQEAFNPIGRIG
jgi:hypothetical protein